MKSGSGGLRVLVVEDEVMVAMHIEDMLDELGHAVVGVAARLEQALAMARSLAMDLAILDVNLDGKTSFPVADLLKERAVPFIFASGYDVRAIESAHRAAPRLQKPYELHDLERAITQALDAANRADVSEP